MDVTYIDSGVEDTFAAELIRTDQVAIGEAGAAEQVGETVIHFADDAYIAPSEARKLAEALVELANSPRASGDRAARISSSFAVHHRPRRCLPVGGGDAACRVLRCLATS